MIAPVRIAPFCMALCACLSDLSVGVGTAEISVEEAGSPVEVEDAGTRDAGAARDAGPARDELDAASADAARAPDASAPTDPMTDAAQPMTDAALDAGSWLVCPEAECLIGFTRLTYDCDDASVAQCARPSRREACEWTCSLEAH